ncbi:hypothetical protein CO2235_10224 [Cupriavidus oxalaticus]|uniref:Uncharacterized protein n=1 Tax=Cupriavidus oxalaticus TaxID=96344 RepID=A0A375FZ69_9BURK|nr:hypothetical protein CO2235_10224 [Cupriavidus oxalaticus]
MQGCSSWMRRPSPPAPLPQAGEGSKVSICEGWRACRHRWQSHPLPRAGAGWGRGPEPPRSPARPHANPPTIHVNPNPFPPLLTAF